MTRLEYNYLSEEDKLKVVWYIWGTYINLDAPSYNQELHFLLYGSRRLMVNSKPIMERGSTLFNNKIILELDISRVPQTDKKDFPIEHLSKQFNQINKVKIKKSIPKIRFHWIDFKIEQGDIFFNTNNNGHGTKSAWGLGCNNDHFDWTCEIPMQYLEPIDNKL
jgi:hypothetical protein